MDKLREKLYKEMESWVSDLVTDSDLQNVNYYQIMHMNIALRTRSLIFSMVVMMKNGMIIIMTLLQKKTTHWNIYTQREYMGNVDTANIQDVIIDFMYFEKGYYEFVNE